MSNPLFCISDLVVVDDKDVGYILDVTINDNSILYKVKYSIDSRTEIGIEQTRCRPTTMFNNTSN